MSLFIRIHPTSDGFPRPSHTCGTIQSPKLHGIDFKYVKQFHRATYCISMRYDLFRSTGECVHALL